MAPCRPLWESKKRSRLTSLTKLRISVIEGVRARAWWNQLHGTKMVSPGSHTATYGVAPRARGKRAKSGASGSNLPRRVRRQAG